MAPERHRCGFESLHIMNIFFVLTIKFIVKSIRNQHLIRIFFVFMLNRIFEVRADLASPMLNLLMAFNAESER